MIFHKCRSKNLVYPLAIFFSSCYNIHMEQKTRKNLIKIGLTVFCTAILAFGASLMPNFGMSSLPTAKADGSAATGVAQDNLITPTSYEQYLPLQAPADVAVSDDFTAIADGNLIYVYNKAKQVYRTYTHDSNATADLNVVSNLEFSQNGDLYFIDGNAHMHVLEYSLLRDVNAPLTTKADFPTFFCNTFILSGNDLYFAVSSEASAHLSRTDASSPDASTATLIVGNLSKAPVIAYCEDTLYYTDVNGNFLNKISLKDNSVKQLCAFTVPIFSLAVSGDQVFLTNTNSEFYVYNRTTLGGLAYDIQPLDMDKSGGYKTLSTYKDYVYAIRDCSVRQYAIGKGFTQFEIAANSSSGHRLQNATDMTLEGDKLYVADGGNSRISIYDAQTNVYQTISLPAPAKHVAAYGNTVLAADETTAWLIDLSAAETVQSFQVFGGNVAGITAVYDKYYLATTSNTYYTISLQPTASEEGQPAMPSYEWQMSDGIQKENTISPTRFTSDVYGNFYVVAGNDLYKFTETELLLPDNFGKEALSLLPPQPEKILVDLNENVYVLKDRHLHVYAYTAETDVYEETATILPLSAQLVYGQTENTPITSLAFNVYKNTTYVLYEGNLVTSTTRLQLPTVQQIPTNAIEQTIFAEGNAEFKVVETKENAFLIKFDLQQLNQQHLMQSVQNFPYLAHGRESESRVALMLGQAGEYSVLAIFDKETHTYSNYLTKSRYFVQEKSESDYLVEYDETEKKTGYLTNALLLYKYPYLTDLLRAGGMEKNAAVRLVGEVNQLDYDYYKIEIEDEAGNLLTGFIPKSYVTFFDGSPKPSETHTYGEQSPNEESIWRLTYLLLGAAAICVLLDLLILQRKPKDEE